ASGIAVPVHIAEQLKVQTRTSAAFHTKAHSQRKRRFTFCFFATSLSHSRLQGKLKMTHTFKALLNDEAGFIISAELVLVMTIGVLAMVVGLTAVRDSVTHELNDISHAFGTVSQSYNVTGLKKGQGYRGSHGYIQGFGFNDSTDECDCHVIELVDVCGKDDPSWGDDE
ncbi:MAG: Flp pilus assembly pilin Flp, partial [Planctomycetaceae bacterium]